jgi:hypothetical protein
MLNASINVDVPASTNVDVLASTNVDVPASINVDVPASTVVAVLLSLFNRKWKESSDTKTAAS